MSILNTALALPTFFPAGLVGPAVAAARPLFGAGALATFFMMFKPMIVGVLQAVKLVFRPRLSLEERRRRQTLRRATMLHRLAREFDQFEPNQAAELRILASRD